MSGYSYNYEGVQGDYLPPTPGDINHLSDRFTSACLLVQANDPRFLTIAELRRNFRSMREGFTPRLPLRSEAIRAARTVLHNELGMLDIEDPDAPPGQERMAISEAGHSRGLPVVGALFGWEIDMEGKTNIDKLLVGHNAVLSPEERLAGFRQLLRDPSLLDSQLRRRLPLKDELRTPLASLVLHTQDLYEERNRQQHVARAYNIMKCPDQFIHMLGGGQPLPPKQNKLSAKAKSERLVREQPPELSPSLLADIKHIGGYGLAMACVMAHATNPNRWWSAPGVNGKLKELSGAQLSWKPGIDTVRSALQTLVEKTGMLEWENPKPVPYQRNRTRITAEGLHRGMSFIGTILGWQLDVSKGLSMGALLQPLESQFSTDKQVQLYQFLVHWGTMYGSEIKKCLKLSTSTLGARLQRLHGDGILQITHTAGEKKGRMEVRLADKHKEAITDLIQRFEAWEHPKNYKIATLRAYESLRDRSAFASLMVPRSEPRETIDVYRARQRSRKQKLAEQGNFRVYDDYPPRIQGDIDVLGGQPLAAAVLLAMAQCQHLWHDTAEIREALKQAGAGALLPSAKAIRAMGQRLTDGNLCDRCWRHGPVRINEAGLQKGRPLVGAIFGWYIDAASADIVDVTLGSTFAPSRRIGLYSLLVTHGELGQVRRAMQEVGYPRTSQLRETNYLIQAGIIEAEYNTPKKADKLANRITKIRLSDAFRKPVEALVANVTLLLTEVGRVAMTARAEAIADSPKQLRQLLALHHAIR